MGRKCRFLYSLIFGVLIIGSIPVSGQIRLPKLISDGMVLQRDADLKIWGWASVSEKVSVTFLDKVYSTVADDAGKWEIKLLDLQAGGPFSMTITGSNTITVNNILVGEVWVCSGQSNMELNMKRASPIYGPEIASSKNDYIRYFAAPQTYNFNNREEDYKSGTWQTTDPNTVLNFGAIAYFFARELNQKYKVPVGIINTAIGGTPIEAWISEDAIKEFPDYYKEAQKFKDKLLIEKIETQDREKSTAWYRELGQKDEGYKDPNHKWIDPALETADWSTMKIPGYWNTTPLGPVNGIVWFRRDIEVDKQMAGLPAKLLLGRIVDADSVFVNGVFAGTTSYQYPPRRYEVPAGVLKEGKNTIVVKVISNGGFGGFVPDKPYELSAGGQTIDLKGDWHYRLGVQMKPLGGSTTIKYKPVGLFNAMISPLLNYRIKGVLWYQGESNAERPLEYRKLFPALVADWRSNWNEGEFPFLYVQLPNFMEAKDQPSQSNWALFRESQLKSLSIPNTGMAVAIDLGEWNDIHPLNKLDVAKRLFLVAQKVAYGDTRIEYSGPVFAGMKIKGSKVVLSFTHTGSGLVAQNNSPLKEFVIAGEDRKFVWADATIKKNQVIVRNKNISRPVAVRYAWANNPADANLYNKEGLPASPFRTDEW